jgi:hypothetical protein
MFRYIESQTERADALTMILGSSSDLNAGIVPREKGVKSSIKGDEAALRPNELQAERGNRELAITGTLRICNPAMDASVSIDTAKTFITI